MAKDMGDPERAQLIQVVGEDLAYLAKDWGTSIDDAALRRGSTVLRNLLVEGLLQRAWKAAGFAREPSIHTHTLESLLAGRLVKVDGVLYASACGGEYGAGQVSSLVIVNYELTEGERKALQAASVLQEVVRLNEFSNAACILTQKTRVSRHALIKYVANKMGGAHLDHKRSKSAAAEERAYVALDAVMAERTKLLDKNLVYYELLSIGQALVRSPEIVALMRTIDRRGA
jgi:hypothetical protein